MAQKKSLNLCLHLSIGAELFLAPSAGEGCFLSVMCYLVPNKLVRAVEILGTLETGKPCITLKKDKKKI